MDQTGWEGQKRYIMLFLAGHVLQIRQDLLVKWEYLAAVAIRLALAATRVAAASSAPHCSSGDILQR